MPILLKLFQKVGGRNSPKLILLCQHYSDIKARQIHYKKRKSQANIFDEHRCKSFQQNTSNGIQHHIKWIIDNDQVDFIPGMQDS